MRSALALVVIGCLVLVGFTTVADGAQARPIQVAVIGVETLSVALLIGGRHWFPAMAAALLTWATYSRF